LINEKTIWNSQQNHPELVVRDCIKEFNFNEKQCKKLRFIMMKRGINKWLYCRILFIGLKHKIKKELNQMRIEFEKDRKNKNIKWKFNFLNKSNMEMQNIAKTPRWVEWGTHTHKKMSNNMKDITIKGRHC